MIQANVGREATMLSYIDNFHVLAYIIMAMIPLVFFMKKAKSSGRMAVH